MVRQALCADISERFPVIGGKHPLDVRFFVQNLSAQLVVGYHSHVAVVLQSTAAHFQPCRHLPVRQESFAAQNRTTSVWFLLIISLIATLDLVDNLSSRQTFSSVFYGFDDAHHILRLVKHLVVDL